MRQSRGMWPGGHQRAITATLITSRQRERRFRMTMSRAPDALLGPARRLVAVLTDPGRRERAAVAVIAVYAALWALTGMIAKAGEDVHYDMAEMVAGLRGHLLS